MEKEIRITDKKKKILLAHDRGLTLEEAGKEFGITRERVRQIYFRLRKEPWGKLKREWVANRARLKKKKRNKKCEYCGKDIKHLKGRRKYCLPCVKPAILEQQKRSKDTKICAGCGKEFHPLRNYKYTATHKGLYCTNACMWKHPAFRERIAKSRGKKDKGLDKAPPRLVMFDRIREKMKLKMAEMEETKGPFSTSDIDFVSALLCTGKRYQELKVKEGVVYFIFEGKHDLAKLEKDFYNHAFEVDARSIIEARARAKTILFNELRSKGVVKPIRHEKDN